MRLVSEIDMLEPLDSTCRLESEVNVNAGTFSQICCNLMSAVSAFYFLASSLRTRCILVFLPPGSECWDYSRHRPLILGMSGQVLLFPFKVCRKNCPEGVFIYVSTVIGSVMLWASLHIPQKGWNNAGILSSCLEILWSWEMNPKQPFTVVFSYLHFLKTTF